MARIESDFENVDKLIDSALYASEVSNASPQSARDGSINIVWEFTIIEPGDFQGRTLRYYSYLADQRKIDGTGEPDIKMQTTARARLKRMLENLGVPFDPKGFNTEDAIGRKAIIKVVQTKYQDRDVNQIESVMPMPS